MVRNVKINVQEKKNKSKINVMEFQGPDACDIIYYSNIHCFIICIPFTWSLYIVSKKLLHVDPSYNFILKLKVSINFSFASHDETHPII